MKIRKAVMPVAGLGTRSLPATKVIPKEMLPVVDKPLIQYAVEEAVAAGCDEIIFVTSRGKESIEDHFDRHFELEQTLSSRGKQAELDQLPFIDRMGITISTVRQPAPLGLGHAIWCARNLVGNEPFAVILPDDFIHASTPTLRQMAEAAARLNAPMLAIMAVPSDQTSKYGIVAPVDGANPNPQPGDALALQDLIEKPSPDQAPSNLAIIGRYILPPEIFPLLEKQGKGAGGEIQLTDGLVSLLELGPFYGFRFEGVRYDCGDKAGYQMAQSALSLERPEIRARLLPFLRELVAHWDNKS